MEKEFILSNFLFKVKVEIFGIKKGVNINVHVKKFIMVVRERYHIIDTCYCFS